jgi:hypothetical protein
VSKREPLKVGTCVMCGKVTRTHCVIVIYDRGRELERIEQCKDCNPFLPLALRKLRAEPKAKAQAKATKKRAKPRKERTR